MAGCKGFAKAPDIENHEYFFHSIDLAATWMAQDFCSAYLPHRPLFRPTSFPVLMAELKADWA
jgi:hypothetical protein